MMGALFTSVTTVKNKMFGVTVGCVFGEADLIQNGLTLKSNALRALLSVYWCFAQMTSCREKYLKEEKIGALVKECLMTSRSSKFAHD